MRSRRCPSTISVTSSAGRRGKVPLPSSMEVNVLRLTLLATAFIALATAAIAQQTTGSAPPNMPVGVELAIGAVEAPAMSVDKIAAIGTDANVRVVLVSELQGGPTGATVEDLHARITEKAQSVEALREAVNLNAPIKAALLAAEQDASKVIGVATAEDGTILVFVDDGATASP